MSKQPPREPGQTPASFTPVPVRPRAGGWSPERQVAFVEALAATGNVEAACRLVGMSTSAAYSLRARPDASAFREAWGIAIDYAVKRLADAALDRAINGEVTPIFYKGEQIGERRRFDNRLAMFLLRLRDPEGFGAWREHRRPDAHPDVAAARLHVALDNVRDEAEDQQAGVTPMLNDSLPPIRLLSPAEQEQRTFTPTKRALKEARRRYGTGKDASEVDTGGGT